MQRLGVYEYEKRDTRFLFNNKKAPNGAERMFKMNSKKVNEKKVINTKQNVETKAVLNTEELNRLTGEIQTELELLQKANLDVNGHSYRLGADLRAICNLFKDAKQRGMFVKHIKAHFSFTKSYAYMLIKDANIQDILEKKDLTTVKQSEHVLRALGKYENDETTLAKIWKQAGLSKQDLALASKINELVRRESENDESTTDTLKKLEEDTVNMSTIIKILNLAHSKQKLTADQKEMLLRHISRMLDEEPNETDTNEENN